MRQDKNIEGRKKREQSRKTGYNFPFVINFKSQVLRSFSLKPAISFGTWPEAFDLVHFSSRVTRLALGCDLYCNEYMSLEKDHLQKAFTGLTEKNHPIKNSYISPMCLQLSSFLHADLQHLECVIHQGRRRVDSGPISLTPSCSVTERQVERRNPPPQTSNGTTCTERAGGRHRQGFGDNCLSEEKGSYESARGFVV